MNKVIILVLMLSVSFIKGENVKVFIGTWQYQFSKQGERTFILKEDYGLNFSTIVFYKCDYNKEPIPKLARNIVIGKVCTNYLNGICIKTYLNNKFIQKGYPVCFNIYNDSYRTVFYGLKTKEDLNFKILGVDTLIIYDNRYTIQISNNETITNNFSIKHYYVRRK
jgi:hypothetical protein